MNTLEIKEITNDDEFKALRAEWNELLSQSKADTLFLTWEWLWTWWEVYKKENELSILIARENDKLIGCAPLFLSKKSFYGIFKIKQAEFLGSGRVCSDYLDFILYPGQEAEILEAFLSYFERTVGRKWDMLCLSDIWENSSTIDLLKKFSNQKNFLIRNGTSTVCPYLTLPDSFETLLGSLSKQFRKALRQYRRRLAKSGKVELYHVTKEEELSAAMDEFIKLHQIRWQMTGHSGNFYSKNYTKFHKKMASILLKKNWLNLVLLKVNQNVVACRYGFAYNNKLLAYQGGYDPDWSKHSVGLISTSYCIEDAISRGITEYDFLRGTTPIKYRFKPLERKNITIIIAGNTIKSRLYFLNIKLVKSVKNFFKNLINEKFWFEIRNFKDKYKAMVD